MNVSIVCVGKVKDKYILDGIAEFQKRLQPFAKFENMEKNKAQHRLWKRKQES